MAAVRTYTWAELHAWSDAHRHADQAERAAHWSEMRVTISSLFGDDDGPWNRLMDALDG